ncbi:hypothetical protein B0H17DRAFT_1335458 [Mycena rosella]|uniref:Uncharacterized protein n=1 Tax=Mycena rosella TaxID=1033263 RepID=A0AAD7GA51_MYCRO|nr:hypothetical protein B0H17DRAFT_1335458 [Mycena rosella]
MGGIKPTRKRVSRILNTEKRPIPAASAGLQVLAMDTTPPLRQLQQTFGVLFDGFSLSMMGYGFTFFQTYVYFSKYPADHWGLKSFVTAIFALDTASSALLSKALYFYMVSSLPYLGGLTQIHVDLTTHVLLSTITVFGAYLFFSARIWKLSSKIWVTGITFFSSLAAFSLGIALAVMMFNDPAFSKFGSLPFKLALSFACTFTGLASLSIFIGLNQYSRKSAHLRSVVSPEWFDSVSVSLLARGLLAVLIQLGCLVTFLALPHKIYWTPLYFVGAKVIINGPLYMLNSRDRVHGKGINEEDPFQCSATFLSTTGIFEAAPNSSNVVTISSTVEFDCDANTDLAKPGYGSDHGHAARRSFEDGQKRAEAF